MPTCKKCHNSFPNWTILDGKPRSLHKRKFCLECSPFGMHNTRDLSCTLEGTRICPICNKELPIERFYKRGRNINRPHSYCIECTRLTSKDRLRHIKQTALDIKGGKCQLCGYNQCPAALEFHHRDPNQKDFSISSPRYHNLEFMKAELEKCILVCSNCHREIHAGIHQIE
jgi:hypothetical protein